MAMIVCWYQLYKQASQPADAWDSQPADACESHLQIILLSLILSQLSIQEGQNPLHVFADNKDSTGDSLGDYQY